MRRALKRLAPLVLAGYMAACGGGTAGSFKWYGSNPPTVNNRCEWLGTDSNGGDVWQCEPL